MPLLVLLALAYVPAHAEPADEALEALSLGDSRAAIGTLRAALARGDDPELRCLLGEVQHLAGADADALSTLAAVPPEAECARQAAFTRAEALTALGRDAEAADLYAALGADILGADGGRTTAAQLEQLADRLLAREVPAARSAIGVLELALELRLAPERQLALSRRIADLAAEHDLDGRAAIPGLARAIGLEGDAIDRRRLARLVSHEDGLALLAPLPDDLDTLTTRLALARDLPMSATLTHARALIAAFPDAPQARRAQREVGARLAAAGWRLEARALLDPLAAGFDDDAADASWRLLGLAVRGGEDAVALDAAIDHVTRFPRSSHRADADAIAIELRTRLARAAAAAGDTDTAIAHFDAIVHAIPRDPRAGDAALEAARAALRAGRTEEAERRFAEVVARWPGSSASNDALEAVFRATAIDRDDPAAALARIESLAERSVPGAAELAARVREVELGVQAAPVVLPGATPTVRVVGRNLEQVEVRLHRIDPEAFVRDGGTEAMLPELDVEVIAPDRRWTATVPDPRPLRRQAWDLPVPVPGPGLYAVTVATHDRAARAILRVSDTRLVAQRLGAQTVVAVFRGDRPAEGASVLVRSDDGVVTARTDRTGLARLEVKAGSATVLAVSDGGPVLLALEPYEASRPDRPPVVQVDLDRPAYRPGDTLAFRVAALPTGKPEIWRIRLEATDTMPGFEHVFTAGPDGTLTGEVPVPLADPGRADRAATERVARLVARPPWSVDPITLATVRIAAEVPQDRSIAVAAQGQEAVIEVREPDGSPAAGVAVHGWRELGGAAGGEPTLLRTDAAGRARLPLPPRGVPWVVGARLAGTDLSARAWRTREAVRPAALGADQDHLRPGEPLVVRLDGEGPATLRMARRVVPPEPAEAVADPWNLDLVEGQRGERRTWTDDEPDDGDLVTLTEASRELTLTGPRALDLGALPPGSWQVVLSVAGQPELALRVEVDAEPRLLPIGPIGLGSTLRAGAEGGPLLVSVRAGDTPRVAVVEPGRPVAVPVDPTWGGEVTVEAIGPDGSRWQRVLPVSNQPDVELAVTDDGPDWVVAARVLDAAGRPVRGQVVLRAVDTDLVDWAGAPATSQAGPLSPATGWSVTSGVAISLGHGAWSTPIAAALMAEAAREEERRRAARAAEGRLGDNALAGLLATEVPLQLGLEGLGRRVVGLGGGGSGYGLGGLGTRGYGRGSGGLAARRAPQPGERSRVLWAVLDTDAEGRVTARVPRPMRRARWTVDAVAVVGASVGTASAKVHTDTGPALLLPSLAASPPNARAEPVARVVAGSERLVGTLRVDGTVTPLSVAAGAVAEVSLGPVRPGASVRVELADRLGAVIERRALDWKPLPWADPGGSVTVVATGAGGAAPWSWLGLAETPGAGTDPGRAASAGLAALYAARRAPTGDRAALHQRAEQAIVGLPLDPTAYRSVGDVAVAIEALALVRDALPDDAAARLSEAVTVQDASRRDRIRLVHARAVAGLEVNDAGLARLLRVADDLDDEERSLLARALAALGRTDQGRRLVRGAGPHAVLARRALGLRDRGEAEALLTVVPPRPGDPDRAAWIDALPDAPRRRVPAALAVDIDGTAWAPIATAAGGVRIADGAGPVRVTPGARALVYTEVAGPAAPTTLAAVVPRAADALPVRAATPSPDKADVPLHCAPCTIGPGDGLRLEADLDEATVPTGLARVADGLGGTLLQGVIPGVWTVHGLRDDHDDLASLTVTVGARGETALAQEVVVALAEQAVDAGVDAAPLLASRPTLDQWAPERRGRVADLAFRSALSTGTGIVEAFEDLHDLQPDGRLPLDQVARTAAAYRLTRPGRATELWRAGIGAAFLAEAATPTRLEPVVGPLAEVQLLRRVALRYPRVDVVEQTLFDLPDRLGELAEGPLSTEIRAAGVTATDIRLMSAAWSREFLAMHPRSPLADQAGLRLAGTLLRLGAADRAAGWAARTALAHPASPLLDRLALLEGLAWSAAGEVRRARAPLRQVVGEAFRRADGSVGASDLRDDARLALARLREARGEDAREDYREVAGEFGEAQASLQVLEREGLHTGGPLLVTTGEPIRVPVTVAGVDRVVVRAYALDLRTLFLRDGGLAGATEVRVAGVAPVWQGEQRVADRPWPREVELRVPLADAGAWLLRLEAGGQQAATLVVRSDLVVDALDAGGTRRLTVHRRGRPAAGVEVRALSNGIVAAVTDVRGVAMVPAHAAALVFDGDQVAFTRTEADGTGSGTGGDELLQRLEAELRRLRDQTREHLSFPGAAPDGVAVSRL